LLPVVILYRVSCHCTAEMSREKGRKGLISKTLQRCRSIGSRGGATKRQYTAVAPAGYLWLYVGAERERLVVRTEQVNHPLFKVLLDEAEMVYGYKSDGPLELPCDVELFHRVLWEMEDQEAPAASPMCYFTPGRAVGYHLLSPSQPVGAMGRYSV